MHRRGYLGAVMAVGSTALAGCGFLSGGDDGPASTAENFFTALNEGDTATASEYLHERHGSVTEAMSEQSLDRFEELDMTIEETDVSDESDDEATVDLTYSVEGASNNEDARFRLVTDDDEWVIASITS